MCRLFGHSGACSACGQSIPASEMVMRAQGSVYHLKVSVIFYQSSVVNLTCFHLFRPVKLLIQFICFSLVFHVCNMQEPPGSRRSLPLCQRDNLLWARPAGRRPARRTLYSTAGQQHHVWPEGERQFLDSDFFEQWSKNVSLTADELASIFFAPSPFFQRLK